MRFARNQLLEGEMYNARDHQVGYYLSLCSMQESERKPESQLMMQQSKNSRVLRCIKGSLSSTFRTASSNNQAKHSNQIIFYTQTYISYFSFEQVH
jgi:hypothetical protein